MADDDKLRLPGMPEGAADTWNGEQRRMEAIVDEVEKVFARHGVAGLVSVSTHDVSAYGMWLPPEGPVKIEGRKTVFIPEGPELLQRKHEPFYRAMEGLTVSVETASQNIAKIWDLTVKHLRRAKFTAAEEEPAPPRKDMN